MAKTESQRTQDLLQELRERHKTWVILKHSDRFSKGIPDTSISEGRRTLWLEHKLLKGKEQLDFPTGWCNNLVQLETLVKLGGWYHVYDPAYDRTLIIESSYVRDAVINKAYLTIDHTQVYWPGKAYEQLEQLIVLFLGGADVEL